MKFICVNEFFVAKFCLCLVMYDFDEKIKLQNYAFVDVKIIKMIYNFKN